MSAFSDLLSGDDPADQEDLNPRVSFGGVAEPVLRGAVQRDQAANEPASVTGFFTNAAKDVGRFGEGIASLVGQVATHPVASAEAVGGALEHPIDTAKMLTAPLVEKYTPQPGEGIPHMLMRDAYEHPFDTLLDASTVLQGPFGAAAKVADIAGAANAAGKLRAVAEIGKAIDPISIAQKTGRTLMQTYTPDLYALTRTMRANTDKITELTQAQRYATETFDQKAIDAARDLQPDGSEGPLALTPAEHAIKFAYGEGRIPIIKDDMVTEITHRGALESRRVGDGSAIRPEALDAWMAKYKPLQQEMERTAGIAPEQFAEKSRAAAIRNMMYGEKSAAGDVISLNPDFDPFSPEVIQKGDQAYAQGLQEATERQQRRMAQSTLTALDVAKETDFRARAAQFDIDASRFEELQKATGIPHPWDPPTLEEAMQLMGDRGGIIISHSGEVLSREQSTVGNVLTKAQEGSLWKENTGAKFRSELLDQTDPTAALARAYSHAVRGNTFAQIAEDAAQMGLKEGLNVTDMSGKNWNPNLDPDVISGKFQPLHPGSIALDSSVGEHFERLKSRLMEVAPFDKAAADVNLMDTAENMGAAAHETFPLNPGAEDKLYKIPTGMGNALALFKKSFEPATNPLAKASDALVMGPFNMLTINMRAGHLLNRAAGHTMLMAAQGVTPFTARGFMGLLTAGRATLGRYGILNDEVSQKLAKIFDLPGVGTGGISASDALRPARNLGDKLARSENPIARGLGRWAQLGQQANTNLDNIYRAASTMYELGPKGLDAMKSMIHGSASMADMAERIDSLAAQGVDALHDPGFATAKATMNRWLNDYDRTSALDRLTGRYVFPYHKFYKHAAEVLLRAPFEKTVKAQLVRRLGAAALQDTKDQLASYGYDWNTMVPPSQRNSVPLGKNPDGSLNMFTMGALNPFSIVDPNGNVGGEAINLLNPVAKVAIEQATGVNLFTHEKFQGALSTFNGKKIDTDGSIVEDYERPPLVDHYLRQFWPVQALRNVIAHGRQPRDGADLIDMARNAPGTYRLDDLGRQIETPRAGGSLDPILSFSGRNIQVLEPPTKKQTQAQATVSRQEFADLWQQHPERRDELRAALADASAHYSPPSVLPPVRR